MQYSQHTYDIGGCCVRMTAAQAVAWNDNGATADNMVGATIFLPAHIGGEFVPLWQMVKDEDFYRAFLEDEVAELHK